MKKRGCVSKLDEEYLKLIRENISSFLEECGCLYDGRGKLLDIAPQVHQGAAPYFSKAEIFTLDIDPDSEADYIADLCKCNRPLIPDNYFDLIVCTEVLEHTLEPFAAVEEIYRILKPDGLVFISTPFNFRIHGPLPDCWRFTEHGLRRLLKDYRILKLKELSDNNRFLMPIHYTVIAQK